MAGRKRKMIATAGSAADELSRSLNESEDKTLLKSNAATAKLKTPSICENAQSVETEQSPYFTKNLQQKLGEDFFNQPCISLAKAFLGKVIVLISPLHLYVTYKGIEAI